MGAVMGRGGSPMMAARMGQSRGRGAASRKERQREAEERSQEEQTVEGQAEQSAKNMRAGDNQVDNVHGIWDGDNANADTMWRRMLEQHKAAGTSVAKAVGANADEMNRIAREMGVNQRERFAVPARGAGGTGAPAGPSRPGGSPAPTQSTSPMPSPSATPSPKPTPSERSDRV